MVRRAIETDRLILRRWREADREPMARMHADSEVMSWLGRGPLSAEESDAYLDAFEEDFESQGFGAWAIERQSDGAWVGLAGMHRFDSADHPLSPCVEIVWRQARSMWGNGYITEAARAALADGFERIGLEEVFAWTAAANRRSQAVMERVGMRRDEAHDFDSVALPVDHPLRRHVVFRIARTS